MTVDTKESNHPKLNQHAGAGMKIKYPKQRPGKFKRGKSKITGVPIGKTKKAPGKLQSSLGLSNVGISERYIRKAQKHAQRESKYEQKLDIAKAEINRYSNKAGQYTQGSVDSAKKRLADYKKIKYSLLTANSSRSSSSRKRALQQYKTEKKRLKAEIARTKKARVSSETAQKYVRLASNMRTKYEAKLKQSKQKKRAYESAYSARMTKKAEKRKYFLVGKKAGKPIINELVGVKQRLGSIEVKLGDEKVPLNVLKPEDIIANPKLADDVLRQFPELKQFATKKDPMFDFTKFDEKHRAELAGKILEHTRNPMPGMENFPEILKDINETAFSNYKDTQTPYGIHKALEAKRLAFEELRAKRKLETGRQQSLDHRLSINFTGQMPSGWDSEWGENMSSNPDSSRSRIKDDRRPVVNRSEHNDSTTKSAEGELSARNPLFERYSESGMYPARQDFSNLPEYGDSPYPSSIESLYSDADTHPNITTEQQHRINKLESATPKGEYSANSAYSSVNRGRGALANDAGYINPEYAGIQPGNNTYMDIEHAKTPNKELGEYVELAGIRKGTEAGAEYMEIGSGPQRQELPPASASNQKKMPMPTTPAQKLKSVNNTYLTIGNETNPGTKNVDESAYITVNKARGKPATDAGYIDPTNSGRQQNNTYMTVKKASRETLAKDAGYIDPTNAGRRNARHPGNYGDYSKINPDPALASKLRKPMPTTPAPPPFSLGDKSPNKREQKTPGSISRDTESKRDQKSFNSQEGVDYLNISPARSSEGTYADPKATAGLINPNASTGQYMNIAGTSKATSGEYINVTGARKNKGEYMALGTNPEAPESVSEGPRYQVPKGTPVNSPLNNSSPPLPTKNNKKGNPSQPNKNKKNTNKKMTQNNKGKKPEYASLLPRPNTHNTYIEPPRQKEKVEYMTVKPASSVVSNANTRAGYMDSNKLRTTSKTGQYMNVGNIMPRNNPNNAGYMSVNEMRKNANRNKAGNSGYLEVTPAEG